MEKNYAILNQDGKVVNTVVWNGDATYWNPPTGTTAVLVEQVNTSAFQAQEYTTEEWVHKSGYTSIRLLTLLDLEMKLLQAGKTSSKMVAVRQWLDLLLQEYASNQQPQTTWESAPYTFDETVQEARSVLNS